MSDAMTNREIEDVLTSIRRLVAQDGARTADRAVEAPLALGPRAAGKLILTEAQRIDALAAADPAPPAAIEAPVAQTAPDVTEGPAPQTAAAAFDMSSLPSPDFGRLEATIAELEAAVSASGGAWEGEVVEDPPRASNVTDLYGRLHFGPRRDSEAPVPAAPAEAPVQTAAPVPATPATVRVGPTPEPAPPELAKLAAEPADPLDLPIAAPEAVEPPAPPMAAEDSDEVFQLPQAPSAGAESETDADAQADGVEAILDEAALYALVAQIVREELHGQLGERITAQVRKLVRAEIAKALDERKFL